MSHKIKKASSRVERPHILLSKTYPEEPLEWSQRWKKDSRSQRWEKKTPPPAPGSYRGPVPNPPGLPPAARQHPSAPRKDPRLEQRGRAAAWLLDMLPPEDPGQPLLDRKLDAPSIAGSPGEAGPPRPRIAELGEDVWRSDKPPAQRGVVVRGSPVGHPAFVQAWAEERLRTEQQLLEHLPKLPGICNAHGCYCGFARLTQAQMMPRCGQHCRLPGGGPANKTTVLRGRWPRCRLP